MSENQEGSKKEPNYQPCILTILIFILFALIYIGYNLYYLIDLYKVNELNMW
ncbi:MAG: hypothetical protein JW891_00880 [Candidatus Lokiarchaeota archaeon]|nr:hypothetical protein [Candidatus Lokiarchaeota archaeon]